MIVKVQNTEQPIAKCPLCGRDEISVSAGSGQMFTQVIGYLLQIQGERIAGVNTRVCQLCITTIRNATKPHVVQRTPTS